MALDCSADQYEDPPAMRRDVVHATVVELGALHHELLADPLMWCADFAVEKLWHLANVVYQQVQVQGTQICHTASTHDQLKLGGGACMGGLAKWIQSCVDGNRDHDDVSWSDSRFLFGSGPSGWGLVLSLRRQVACQIKAFVEIELAQRRFPCTRVWETMDSQQLVSLGSMKALQ